MTQFDLRQALRNLDIEIKPWGFHPLGMTPKELSPDDGTLRGYSHDRWLTINPEERWPEMVTFHEMTHILRGDTVVHEKFGLDLNNLKLPVWPEPIPSNLMEFIEYKERNHDLIEAECHATAIITCQLTDTPFDYLNEADNLLQYTMGRKIPRDVMERANKTAKKIWAAGKIDARSLQWSGAA